MIADYESQLRDNLLDSPRMYGLTQKHKHLPEMAKISGLKYDPIFCPIVAPYYAGMEVVIPVFPEMFSTSKEEIEKVFEDYYQTKMVYFKKAADENGFMAANAFEGKDTMEISVEGNEERVLLISRFDNLGKGASGAAIQNMNIALGLEESTGLVL